MLRRVAFRDVAGRLRIPACVLRELIVGDNVRLPLRFGQVILAASSVMAASGAVWAPAVVNRARATRAAVNSVSP
jgi:hypothetical protein